MDINVIEQRSRRARAAACEDAAAVLMKVERAVVARDLLREALEIYRSLGDEVEAARVRRQLTEAGRTSSNDPWGRLTPCELEVALLVADGLTTPAIAERLVVSPRTVQTHLRSIFMKLGIDRRARLAAEVVSRGLARAA